MTDINSLIKKYKPLIFEILRFGIVGGVSTVFDWGTLMLVLHFAFAGVETNFSISVCTAIGFVVGVTVNYILSVIFVFKSAKKGAGKDVKSAIIFLIASVVGLLINTVIMNVGTVQMGYNVTLVKIVATLITMIWNYLSRKILIFKSEGK